MGLDVQNFREPLYLKDKPVRLEDTRSEEERKYPELFRQKLQRAPRPRQVHIHVHDVKWNGRPMFADQNTQMITSYKTTIDRCRGRLVCAPVGADGANSRVQHAQGPELSGSMTRMPSRKQAARHHIPSRWCPETMACRCTR